MGLAHRPAHTGLPTITSLYAPSGFSVSKGCRGRVDVFMASIPQRIYPRQPLRSQSSVMAVISAPSASAISLTARRVCPVRE